METVSGNIVRCLMFLTLPMLVDAGGRHNGGWLFVMANMEHGLMDCGS